LNAEIKANTIAEESMKIALFSGRLPSPVRPVNKSISCLDIILVRQNICSRRSANVWRAKFAGNDPAPAAPAANEANATSGTSKRKTAAAKKSAHDPAGGRVGEVDGPKSAEALALDAKIAEHGNLVRDLKARTPRTKEVDEETAAAIAELKKLKAERATLSK
jgi:hypothetical protein